MPEVNPLEERIRNLQEEYKQHYFNCKKENLSINSMDAFIGFATQKIARMELVLEGILAILNKNPDIIKELNSVKSPG